MCEMFRQFWLCPSASIYTRAKSLGQSRRLNPHEFRWLVEIAPNIGRLYLAITVLPMLKGERRVAEKLAEESPRIFQCPELQCSIRPALPNNSQTRLDAFHGYAQYRKGSWPIEGSFGQGWRIDLRKCNQVAGRGRYRSCEEGYWVYDVVPVVRRGQSS